MTIQMYTTTKRTKAHNVHKKTAVQTCICMEFLISAGCGWRASSWRRYTCCCWLPVRSVRRRKRPKAWDVTAGIATYFTINRQRNIWTRRTLHVLECLWMNVNFDSFTRTSKGGQLKTNGIPGTQRLNDWNEWTAHTFTVKDRLRQSSGD